MVTKSYSFLQELEKTLKKVRLPEGILYLDDDQLLRLRPSASGMGHHASFVVYLWRPHVDGRRLWYKPILMNLRTAVPERPPSHEDILDWLKTEVGLIAKRFAVEIERGNARITTDGGEIEIREDEDTLHYAGSRR